MLSSGRLLSALVLSLALMLAAVAGWWVGRRASTRVEPSISSAPVVTAVRDIAKLATVEVEVADVIRYEEVRTIVVFDVPKNATLRLRGTVTGGFDLAKGFRVDVEEKTRLLRVHLPPPEILTVDARIEWFDEKSGWLNPITPEDRTRWSTWARGALGRAAKDAGILEQTNRRGRELLSRAAGAFGWTVRFEPPGPVPKG
ncbi:MAG: DUF4230 domain-containing protein [Thermoanaerobaculia bacterium]|nr:DUF4230 domain-containing protein [Thermoanaerobaculia bacterium]